MPCDTNVGGETDGLSLFVSDAAICDLQPNQGGTGWVAKGQGGVKLTSKTFAASSFEASSYYGIV